MIRWSAPWGGCSQLFKTHKSLANQICLIELDCRKKMYSAVEEAKINMEKPLELGCLPATSAVSHQRFHHFNMQLGLIAIWVIFWRPTFHVFTAPWLTAWLDDWHLNTIFGCKITFPQGSKKNLQQKITAVSLARVTHISGQCQMFSPNIVTNCMPIMEAHRQGRHLQLCWFNTGWQHCHHPGRRNHLCGAVGFHYYRKVKVESLTLHV